jgi:excinuclease UvrABC ATPase subunit
LIELGPGAGDAGGKIVIHLDCDDPSRRFS